MKLGAGPGVAMKVQHYRAARPIRVEEIERTSGGVVYRRVISEVDGAANFTMDIFEIAPGGHSGFHVHPWEHEVFVIRGRGVVVGPDGEAPFGEGDVIFIPPDEPHQFRNAGDIPVEFICLIPQAALTAYYLEHMRPYTPADRA
jgi:quercetin dioxygenase-like cupin family protein